MFDTRPCFIISWFRSVKALTLSKSGVQFPPSVSVLTKTDLSHESVCIKLSVKQQMQHVLRENFSDTGLSGDSLMVPTEHSWNIMELQYEGWVPDREGQGGWYVFWSYWGIPWNINMKITVCLDGKTQTAKTTSVVVSNKKYLNSPRASFSYSYPKSLQLLSSKLRSPNSLNCTKHFRRSLVSAW